MHTLFTTDLARQIVSDRLREADAARLARKFRGRGRAAAAGNDGSGTSERVTPRAKSRPALFTSDIIGAR
jgi:hypothetical protein